VLFGNQTDRAGDQQVSLQEAQELGDEHDMAVFEGSAKSSDNVQEAFASLARWCTIPFQSQHRCHCFSCRRQVKKRWEIENGETVQQEQSNAGIDLQQKEGRKKSKGCC
jgi:hypothetical protein